MPYLKKSYNIKFSIENFLILFYFILILFYSKSPFQSYNYHYWKYNLIIYLLYPSISFFILNNHFKNKIISIEIKIEDFLIGSLFFFFSVFFYLKNLNLFADEIAYAHDSFLLVKTILNKIDFIFTHSVFLNTIPIKYVYQAISLSIWVLVLFFFHQTTRIKKHNIKVLLVILSLITLRLITFLLSYRTGHHPALNNLFPNIFCSIFGLSEIGFKLSNVLIFLIYYLYLLNRLKFNFCLKVLSIISILSIEQISMWSTYIEQSNYAYLAFLFFMIEVSFIKSKPKYLFFFVSLTIWFRYSNIVLVFPAFIYSLIYQYKKSNQIRDIVIKSFRNSLPLIIALPCLHQIFFVGTHSTTTLNEYINLIEGFNNLFKIELLKISLKDLEVYIIIILFLLINLLKNRNFLIITFFILITSSYLALVNLSDTDIAHLKYSFEFVGFLLVFSILYFYKTLNTLKKKYIFFSIFLSIRIFMNLNPNSYFEDKVTKSDYLLKSYKSDYIYNFIKTYKIIDKVFIHDYPLNNNFMFLLNGFNKFEINQYNFNSDIYNSRKNTNWYTIDIKALNEIESISYIFASSIVPEDNLNYYLKLLESNYKWKKIILLPNFNTVKDIVLLERI